MWEALGGLGCLPCYKLFCWSCIFQIYTTEVASAKHDPDGTGQIENHRNWGVLLLQCGFVVPNVTMDDLVKVFPNLCISVDKI